jgi:transposase InsO family protein
MAMGGAGVAEVAATSAGPPLVQPYPGHMRRPGPVTRAVISLALWPLIIIFSPLIVLAGEPVNRYVMRRVRRRASAAQMAVARHSGSRAARAAAVPLPVHASLLLTVISNPLWIALTAPGRWISDRFRGHPRAPAGR